MRHFLKKIDIVDAHDFAPKNVNHLLIKQIAASSNNPSAPSPWPIRVGAIRCAFPHQWREPSKGQKAAAADRS